MASFLLQYSYTPQAWAALMKNPTNRREVVKHVTESIGGTLVGCWFAFGKHDVVVVVDGVDEISAAACSIAVAASGSFHSILTTPLISMEDGVAAMKKAGTLGYVPPTGS